MADDLLQRPSSPMADGTGQLKVLRSSCEFKSFEGSLAESGLYPLRATGIEVLQINVGRLCNMTCAHCHVDAGPGRREIMSRETAEACIDALARTDIPTLDLTGGAPEMNPNFRWIVEQADQLDRHVIDRCNLTILRAPGYTEYPEFLAEHGVEIVASLPCYLEENVDLQRGGNAFKRSIEVLRRLNDIGYGMPDSKLVLTLVYNPVGPNLPPDQLELEAAYQRELDSRYGIQFSRLYAITNLPVGRYLDHLLNTGQFEQYMRKLIQAYNPTAAAAVMCRTMLSVDWKGRLYDCDFNQMLTVPVRDGLPRNIRQFDPRQFAKRRIVTGQYCYGCAAGAGSSCQGAIA